MNNIASCIHGWLWFAVRVNCATHACEQLAASPAPAATSRPPRPTSPPFYSSDGRPFFILSTLAGAFGEIIIESMFGRSPPPFDPPPELLHRAMPDLRDRFFSSRSRSR